MFQLIKDTKIDFIGKRYYAYVISAILFILGVVAVIQVARGKANLGIDFEGGSMVQLRFSPMLSSDKMKSIEMMRSALTKAGFSHSEIQSLGKGDILLVRIRKSDLSTGRVSGTIRELCQREFPKHEVTLESSEEVGPAVGKSLRQDALNAIFIAMVLIFIYIWFRFEWRFGLGAVIATLHDVLAILGVFYVMNKEVNLLLITALLTLAGYSLTDTVVVFDRIRENLKLRRKEPYMQVFNVSINEVLSRTIITSTTVFLVVIALYFLGSNVTKDFSLALCMGIIVGTYSSIFVASPIVIEIDNYLRAKAVVKK